MRRIVVGVVAVVVATSVFTLTGLGLAEAASMIPNTHAAAAGFSPTAEAAALSTLHDSMESQWHARDAGGLRTTQAALATELAKLRAPQGKAAMTPNAINATGEARRQNSQLGAALAALPGHGESASDLPAPPVGSLASLVQSLLAAVLSVITGLLGGLPIPPPPAAPVTTPVTVPVTTPAAAPATG